MKLKMSTSVSFPSLIYRVELKESQTILTAVGRVPATPVYPKGGTIQGVGPRPPTVTTPSAAPTNWTKKQVCAWTEGQELGGREQSKAQSHSKDP